MRTLIELLYGPIAIKEQALSGKIFLWVVKFADDTTVVGLIRDDHDLTYRDEVEQQVGWCSSNNLILNGDKTKGIIVDFRKKQTNHAPLLTNNCGAGQQHDAPGGAHHRQPHLVCEQCSTGQEGTAASALPVKDEEEPSCPGPSSLHSTGAL